MNFTIDAIEKTVIYFLLMACVTAWFIPIVNTSYASSDEIGKFTMVRGSVDAMQEMQKTLRIAKPGMSSYLLDVIRSKRRSRARLIFIDNSVLNMGSNYMVKIKEFMYDEDNGIRRTILTSLRGTVRATVAKMGMDTNSLFEIETPTSIVSVRGTDLVVKVKSSLETEVSVLTGTVVVRNKNPNIKGEVLVHAGERTTVRKDEVPSFAVKVPITMMHLLMQETSPEQMSNGTTAKAVTTQTGDMTAAVVPPPPTAMTSQRQFVMPRIMRRSRNNSIALPPVQPPVMQSFPALLTAPITITPRF